MLRFTFGSLTCSIKIITMLLFFDSDITEDTQEFNFDRNESKHIIKVLRKEIGTEISLTNGKGLEWKGKLNMISTQKVTAQKTSSTQHSPQVFKVHLAIAPTKRNERMEWLVEKLTELGVCSITPILCEYSERKTIKTERLRKIAISALKQSQQFYIPEIYPLTPFKNHLKQIKKPALIAHCEDHHKKLISEYSKISNDTTLFIGPEGDFSPDEIEAALAVGVQAISLGKQRFRTETAGLLGCHALILNHQKN